MDIEKLAELAALVVPCPDCDGTLSARSMCVAGMPIIVSASCYGCGRAFDFDWPAGHALLHPVFVDRETEDVHVGGKDWYARRVVGCLASRKNPASVEITVRGECRPGRDAVLVNCIDFIYSHVLLKLMSVPRHMRESPDDDVVVIVPKFLAWLVPAGVVSIEVDLPPSRGTEWVEGLDATVDRVLMPSRAVRISPAVSQPEVTNCDLAMLGVDLTPQSLATGDTPLQVGFILRSDRHRLWLGPPNLVLRFARRLLPERLIHRLHLRRQHRNYENVARLVRKRHPHARFIALGIGNRGGLPDFVRDLRTPGPIREELPWLEDYRRCHIVVGNHGANMLLASLLAGAVVELIPASHLADFGEDLIIPGGSIPDPKWCLFRYRVLPEASSPVTVAETVLSVIDDADFLHKNFIENRRAYETVGWPSPIHLRRLAPEADNARRIGSVSGDEPSRPVGLMPGSARRAAGWRRTGRSSMSGRRRERRHGSPRRVTRRREP